MTISIQVEDQVQIKFQGKINMSQEVVISKKDAQQPAAALGKLESSSFETE